MGLLTQLCEFCHVCFVSMTTGMAQWLFRLCEGGWGAFCFGEKNAFFSSMGGGGGGEGGVNYFFTCHWENSVDHHKYCVICTCNPLLSSLTFIPLDFCGCLFSRSLNVAIEEHVFSLIASSSVWWGIAMKLKVF